MIYCPECGTANRDGSRYCNECGQRLGAFTRVKCPACGSMNPVQAAFCSECGGRLLPGAAETEAADEEKIEGLSLPANSSTDGEEEEVVPEEPVAPEDEVPAWLRELGARWHEENGALASDASEGSEDMPDWLRDLRDTLPDAQEMDPPEESEAPEGPIPREPTEGANENNEEVPLTEAEENGAPDWLSELRDTGGAEAEETEETSEAEEGEKPDWLTELRDAAEAETAEDEVPEEEELPEGDKGVGPDWLTELHEMAGVEFAGDEVREEEKIRDQVAEVPPLEIETPEAAQPEATVPVAAGEEGEAPEQVAKADIPEESEADEGISDSVADLETEEPEPEVAPEEEPSDRLVETPLPVGTETEEDEVLEPEEEESPDWLVETVGLAEEEGLESGEPSAPTDEEVLPAALVPGWMADIRPPAELPPAADQAQADTEAPDWLVPAAGQDEVLARAEIPDWLLDLKPEELWEEGEPREFEPVAQGPVEETGILAGLQGVLPVEMIIAQPRSVSEMEALEASVAIDAPQVKLFGEIVGRPPRVEPKELAQPQQQRQLGFLSRSLIFIALIAVVTLPLLVQEPLWPRNTAASTPVQNLYEEIELLDEGSLVLVAFDYDPSTSDEMNILAQVLIDHLMARGAGIVAVSLYPAGPPVAQAVLDELAAQHPDYAGAYGSSYVNLGYLPGQATAVRLLGQSFSSALPQDLKGKQLADLPLVGDVASLQDFSLIMELAASEQSVRWWVEQAATPYSVPLAGGISASVVPLARPYYQTESRQLVGLAGGLPDAAAYAALRGDVEARQGALAARLDSLTGGHLVFILVLAVGSVIQFLRGNRGGR